MPKVSVAGHELHWVGTAPTIAGTESQVLLVLIHGAGGNHSHWAPQLAYLRRRGVRAAAFDLPGHGHSSGEAPSSIATYAHIMRVALESILANERPGTRLAVAGHSMGGAIALELALSRPPWLAGLGLVATGARLRVLPSVLEKLQQGERDLRLLHMAYGPSADPDMLRRGEREYTQVPVRVLYHDYLACNAFDRLHEVADLRLPTLVICGTEDFLTPPRYSAFMAEQTAGRLVLVPGAGHMVMLEQPEAVSEALEEFVQSLQGNPQHPDGDPQHVQGNQRRAPTAGSEAGTCV